MKYVYIAGPFFNAKEIENVEYVEQVLAQKGYEFETLPRYEFEGKMF